MRGVKLDVSGVRRGVCHNYDVGPHCFRLGWGLKQVKSTQNHHTQDVPHFGTPKIQLTMGKKVSSVYLAVDTELSV